MKTSLGTADLIKFLNKTKTEICKNIDLQLWDKPHTLDNLQGLIRFWMKF